jgi:hypothetical protein
MPLTPLEIEALRTARQVLEHPGLAAKISDMVGMPIEEGLALLPDKWHAAVKETARQTIEAALRFALWTMKPGVTADPPSNWWHKLAAVTSGAAGGAFGLAALAVELPVSTAIMLRSIADIARSQGEDLSSPATRLQCIQVLALGGLSRRNEAAETGYFTVRTAMAKTVSDAAAHLAQKTISDKGAPALVRLVNQIGARFSIVVSEKAAAQAVPLVGAFGGALINTLFIDHFQDIAKAHFTIRRLERLHGTETVRRIYEEL